MFTIYEYSGVVGALKSTLVCKDWRNTLCNDDWDERLWRRLLRRERWQNCAPQKLCLDVDKDSSDADCCGESKGETVGTGDKKQKQAKWRQVCSKWYHEK